MILICNHYEWGMKSKIMKERIYEKYSHRERYWKREREWWEKMTRKKKRKNKLIASPHLVLLVMAIQTMLIKLWLTFVVTIKFSILFIMGRIGRGSVRRRPIGRRPIGRGTIRRRPMVMRKWLLSNKWMASIYRKWLPSNHLMTFFTPILTTTNCYGIKIAPRFDYFGKLTHDDTIVQFLHKVFRT